MTQLTVFECDVCGQAEKVAGQGSPRRVRHDSVNLLTGPTRGRGDQLFGGEICDGCVEAVFVAARDAVEAVLKARKPIEGLPR